MVSTSEALPSIHLKTDIFVAFSKDAFISLSDFFKSYFKCLQRSDCLIPLLIKASISSFSNSKNGAVGFLLGVF